MRTFATIAKIMVISSLVLQLFLIYFDVIDLKKRDTRALKRNYMMGVYLTQSEAAHNFLSNAESEIDGETFSTEFTEYASSILLPLGYRLDRTTGNTMSFTEVSGREGSRAVVRYSVEGNNINLYTEYTVPSRYPFIDPTVIIKNKNYILRVGALK